MSKSKYTQEFLNLIENYYIKNDISLSKLSKNSKRLFGKHINYNHLKQLSVDNDWTAKRAMSASSVQKDATIHEMSKNVMTIVYESILDDWETKKELEPAKVNAFINLSIKSSVGGEDQLVATRTSIQDILEEINKEDGED